MALAVLMNLGFAGGTGGADPPTAGPGEVVVLSTNVRNLVSPATSGNILTPDKSKNSVTLE